MGKERFLGSSWFIRIVLITWIFSAIFIFVIFKNMEYIVHGQLYHFGLRFSAEWADPYRFLTWMIFASLGIPAALTSVALIHSFSTRSQEVSDRDSVVAQEVNQPQVVGPAPQMIIKDAEELAGDDADGGISCTNCGKMFKRALVMLDSRGGSHQLVSVCPYCSHVLRDAEGAEGSDDDCREPSPEDYEKARRKTKRG